MDWSRAKNILILIFVLLNVFLSATIISELKGNKVTKEIISNAKLALKERGVEVNCNISDYNGSVGNLTYKKMSFDRMRLVQNIFGEETVIDELLEQGYIERNGRELRFLDEYSFVFKNFEPEEALSGLNNPDKVLGYVEKLLKGTELPVLDFKIDFVEHENEGTETYVFRQKYRDFWVIENHITVNLSEDYLEIVCRYQKVDSIKNSKKVMPVYQVLLKNHEIIKDIAINKIELGFKNSERDDGRRETDGIPVWCVEIESNGNKVKKYFNAYDGDEIE